MAKNHFSWAKIRFPRQRNNLLGWHRIITRRLLERLWCQTTLTLKTIFLCKCGKYMDLGGIWKLIFIKFWWSGDAGTLTARDPVDPRVLFHPLVVHCTTNLPPRSWRLSRIVDRRPVPSWFLDIQGEHSIIQKLRFKDNWFWIGKHHCFDVSLSSLLISGIKYKYQV